MKRRPWRRAFVLLAFAGGGSLPARAAPAPSPGEVAQAISERRVRVEEFQLIREAAQELGFRVWLFGGTAAGFAHYVRWDLAREGGDPSYREGLFDYDFTSIYRSTQDADLVVDASPEQAEALERLIRRKMSFLQGSKEHWEVRLLRFDRTAPGGQVKQALLANPDFLEQHTDSNSTGMIELTDPPLGEGVVRDLRDWESGEPFFLQDVTVGRLHYYRSEGHERTTRFQQGDNPPLFSVIRYLVKAFQYGLKVDGEDLKTVKETIEAFDPDRDYRLLSTWAKGWLERYGPNLIRHSVDVEYAWNTLEKLGLRDKLLSLSDPSEEGSLAWWLSREPLRAQALGAGTGATARELGITMVAHETRDFLAYESMTRDLTGQPNLLISRPGYPGESAALGPGFYTQKGKRGAAGTGLTIRFTVDPEAREGTDFRVQGDYVLFLNRAALRVVPESLDASWPEYFQMIRDQQVDDSDRGVVMKLKRRLSRRPMTGAEKARIAGVVAGEIDRVARKGGGSALLEEWSHFPLSSSYPELVERLRQTVWEAIDRPDLTDEEVFDLVGLWSWFPASVDHPELLVKLIEERYAAARTIFTLDRSMVVRDAVLDSAWSAPGWYARQGIDVSFTRRWSEHPEVVRALIRHGLLQEAQFVLEDPQWAGHPELVLEVIERLPPSFDLPGLVGHTNPWHSSPWRFAIRGHWANNPVLRALCKGAPPTVGRLRRAVWEEASANAARLGEELAALGPGSPVDSCR